MFIFIFESGDISKQPNLNDDDLEAADDGFVDIIDISDPENPLIYRDGGWIEIDSV